MSEERRAAPVTRPDPDADTPGQRSPSASDEHPTPPDTDPTVADSLGDSIPPSGGSSASADDAAAALRPAASRDMGARRRSRMLRIPDDEISRPNPAVSEPSPSPPAPRPTETAGSRPAENAEAPPIASPTVDAPRVAVSDAPRIATSAIPRPAVSTVPRPAPAAARPVESAGVRPVENAEPRPAEGPVLLTPMRIINIGPSEPTPSPMPPSLYGAGEIPGSPSKLATKGSRRPGPTSTRRLPQRRPLPSSRSPPTTSSRIDSEPSEPAPVSVEPTSFEQLGGEPSVPPPAPVAVATVHEPDSEDIALDDDLATPAVPHVERTKLPGERHSDPGSEISVEDLLAVDAAPSPRAPMPSAQARPGGPSQAPVPPKLPLVIVPPHVGTMAPQPADGATARRKGRLWWEDLFNDDYLRTCERLTDAQISSRRSTSSRIA